MGQIKTVHRGLALTLEQHHELEDRLGRPVTWPPHHVHNTHVAVAREGGHDALIPE